MKGLILSLVWAAAAVAQQGVSQYVFSDVVSPGHVSEAVNMAGVVPSKHTFAVIYRSGSTAACTWKIEGSLDKENWYDMSGDQSCIANVMLHMVDRPVMYIRFRVTALNVANNPRFYVRYVGVR